MDSLFSPYLVSGVCAAIVVACSFNLLRRPNLDHIPVVGHSSLLASYWYTKGLEVDLARLAQEGFNKYKSGVFRVANLTHWVVFFHRNHLEQVARASEADFSAFHALDDSLKMEYTVGLKMDDTPPQRLLIRSDLTRNLPSLFADVRDEIVTACDDHLNPKHNEWQAISVARVISTIACRATNRILVGLPLCRDPGWIDFNANHLRVVIQEARILRLFPKFMLDRLVAKFVTDLSGRTKQGIALTGSIIKERLQHMEAEGTSWRDKPDDFLQWWLDTQQETCPVMVMRHIFSVNFASNHSLSTTFSEALLNLAGNPHYGQELRDEVEAVVSEHGWTRGALSKMHKVDSFLKESQRFEGIGDFGFPRKAMSDITLADRTFIPQGTILSFPLYAMHHDDAVYENPHVFEPFRFADMRGKEFAGSKHHMVTVTPDMLAFGFGTHACPGRFFAATVLKTLLAHIVMSYDVKLEGDKSRPNTLHLGRSILPNPAAKVMFRKRAN
ncbi:cytochrome P450 [Pisolithus marmoratus]|nr:cytochrome P450 [Pisolithus marmoratus]